MGLLDKVFGKSEKQEDPKIYGDQLKSFRDTIRSNNGSTSCLMCNAPIHINFNTIEQQIRRNQQIAKQSSRVVLFSPDPDTPKVCRTCKGVICSSCAKKAIANKRNDKVEIQMLMIKYQPMFLLLPEEDKNRAIEACLSPSDSSTILCPKCRSDLIGDIDHITD